MAIQRARAFIQRLWSAAPIATTILALALAATVFFGVRLGLDAIQRADPRNTPEAIQPWMTPRFVSHAWKVPREEMAGYLELPLDGPPPKGKKMNLRDLADERGVPVEDLIAELTTFVLAYRAEHMPPQNRPDE